MSRTRACMLLVFSTLAAGLREEDFDGLRILSAASEADDPCPHIKAATQNSGLHGFQVPYRIAQTRHGLGVFTLRDIRRGEPVYKDLDETAVELTRENWRREVKKHIEQGSWWNDPEVARAKLRLMV